jgi:hypothetical protein
MVNWTNPYYGISLNASTNTKIYLNNATIEPANRNFPYYFNCTAGGNAARTISIHNSTIAMYAGVFYPQGYVYLFDSNWFQVCPATLGSSMALMIYGLAPTVTIQISRIQTWNHVVPWSVALYLVTGSNPSLVGGFTNSSIVGGAIGLQIDGTFSAGIDQFLDNVTIYSGTQNGTGYIRTQLDTVFTDAHPFTVKTPFNINVDANVNMTVRDASNTLIGTYTCIPGTSTQLSVIDTIFGTTMTVVHPFPWKLTITSSFTDGYYYLVSQNASAPMKVPSSAQWAYPYQLAYSGSIYSVYCGENQNIHIKNVGQSVFVGVNNYVQSNALINLGLALFAWSQLNFSGLTPSGLRVTTNNLVIETVITSSLSWSSDSTGETAATFTLSGLESGGGIYYNVYVDGNRIEQIRCDSGSITFSYSGPWSEHTFEVELYDPWGPLYDMGPPMLYIGVTVGLIAIMLVAVGSRIRRR